MWSRQAWVRTPLYEYGELGCLGERVAVYIKTCLLVPLTGLSESD